MKYNIDAFLEDLNEEVESRRNEYPLPVMAFTAYVSEGIAVNKHFVVHRLKKHTN